MPIALSHGIKDGELPVVNERKRCPARVHRTTCADLFAAVLPCRDVARLSCTPAQSVVPRRAAVSWPPWFEPITAHLLRMLRKRRT